MKTSTALAALLGGVAFATVAIAQTTTTQPPTTIIVPAQPVQPMQPGTGAQPMQQPMSQQGANLRPMANPQPGQMLSSDLRGTTVYGMNNENIGPINDLLLDRDGRVAAVIVGVGGFLGIGQKDVAVPFQALDIQADNRTAMGTGVTGTGTGVTGAGTGAGTAGTGMGTTGAGTGMGTTGAGRTGAADTTGAVGAGGANAGRVATVNPQRVVLRGMTRQDLDAAPAFRADGTAR